MTGVDEEETPPSVVHSRRKRTAELSLVTSPLSFTATVSDRTLPTSVTASDLTRPTADSTAPEEPGASYSSASHSTSTNMHMSADPAVFGTSVFSPTSVPHATLPPWLAHQSQAGHKTSDPTPLALTSGQLRLSTHDASSTGHFSTRSAVPSGTTGGGALTSNTASLTFLQPKRYYLLHCL